jgi:anti-sigma factor RsiW
MDCHVIQPDLVPYHFAELEDDARRSVETHLTECPACLRDFIALKRAMEISDERPSPAAKARLQEAVTREIAAATPRRSRVAWSWWERPLAAAFASAAVVAAIMMVQTLATSHGAPPHGAVQAHVPD